MAIENFGVNTLIIPMDVAYQNAGMFKGYGLVYNLLSNGIPVKWAIQPGKTFDGTDFTASAVNIVTLAVIVNHNYTGGPFIIDSAYEAMALPFITAWQALYPSVAVHRATAPFSAYIASTMTRAPLMAVEETNSGIMFKYLTIAAIPDSNGNPWNNTSPDVLDETDMANGAFFGGLRPTPPAPDCRRIKYDIFLSPHTGDSTWNDPIRQYELDEYLRRGGFLHATCHSVLSIENLAGPFLTQAGIPQTDLNKGDTSTFTVDAPDFPSAQAVSTGQNQALPGGSFGSVYHLTPGLVYNSETQILAHFMDDSKQYDFMIAGPYKNGTGAGKIVYEGGHDYGPQEPYSNKDDNLYTRFVLDSIFFSITKPFLFLEYSPTTLFSNVINTITFSIVNNGASPAPNTGFSLTLIPGMNYNNDASIPPTSVVGQTLTWSSIALNTVPPGVVLTFSADYIPPAPVPTKLADFSTSFDDNFDESYSLDGCVTSEVEQFDTADLQVNKTVDIAYAEDGDTLTYTVTITNNGILTASNVVFTDPIPTGAIFVSSSVTLAVPPGLPVPVPGADPSVGVTLPDIPPAPAPGSTVVVTFQVLVDDLDPPVDIVNQSFVNYSFTNLAGTFDAVAESNIVITQVEEGELSLLKAADKTIATVCDTITYTVVVTNTGTVTTNNVFFRDNPPTGTSFVSGSVTVDGNPVAGNPGILPGIPLPSIPVGSSVTVVFQVHVDFVPPPPPDPPIAANTAFIDFTYRVNPQGPDIPGVGISNPIITQLLTPTLNVVKSADKTAADLGETITYTITVTNTGNVTAEDVVLTDPVPSGTTFVPNSVTIAGFPAPGTDPNTGIPIGDIAIGASVEVTFQVTATSIPVPNPTTNIATAAGLFTIEPTEPPKPFAFDSNPVDVQIENAILTPIKSVDKAFVEVGDTLTYTVVIENSGTIVADNVIFTDIPPIGTTFVAGSVTVNGIPVPGNPSSGIPIGSILPGNSVPVTFTVTIDILPVPNPITNIGTVNADFPVDPNNPINKTFDTNPVNTKVELADISVLKTADKEFIEVGDILTYTVLVTNTGTVTNNNVIFTDIPPAGTTFIPDTVRVNGVVQYGANPSTGVNIGSIPPGGFKTVSFKVTVDILPPSGEIINMASVEYEFNIDPNGPTQSRDKPSNPVVTQVELVQLQIIKDVDKSVAIIGETLTYTISIANLGTVTATDVVLNDAIPIGASFVENSVIVNGVAQPGINPEAGIPIGDIPSGGFATVVFSVTVDERLEPPEIVNFAIIDFNVQIDPEGPIDERTEESAPVVTTIEIIELTAVKTADKSYVNVGDTLTYRIEITNTGTLPVENVVFKDQISAGTKLVANSLTVNGIVQPGANPNIGVPIGPMLPGDVVIVEFSVTIENTPCPPELLNMAVITFDYRLDSLGRFFSDSVTSNQIVTDVGLRMFKQFSVEETLTIPEQKPDMEDVLEVNVNVEITSTTLIKTPVVTSFEGQRLTGWKMIVEGRLKQIIVYIADVPQQTIHSAHYDVPFSTFLVLPEDFEQCKKLRVVGYVEDVYYKQLDARTIFKNVTLRVEGISDCGF